MRVASSIAVAVATACTACSPSGGPTQIRDAEVERNVEPEGAVDDGREASIDASADGIVGDVDPAVDHADETAPDGAAEAGACLDAFGPVYVPDADDTAACSASTPCDSIYICFGLSCTDRWECLPHYAPHPCPMELVPHCGCNGVTFLAHPSCVDRPYAYMGPCDDGANCDPTDLRCSQEEPSCPAGSLASIVNGVYGPCVPFATCRCEYLWECPHRENYVCDRTTWRCAELRDQ